MSRYLVVALLFALPLRAEEPAAKPRDVRTVEPRATLAPLWDSAAGHNDCLDANSAESVSRARRGLPPGREPQVCDEATVALLTRGTEVAVEPEAKQCGDMKRVEVMSGKHEGKKGCIAEDQLAAKER